MDATGYHCYVALCTRAGLDPKGPYERRVIGGDRGWAMSEINPFVRDFFSSTKNRVQKMKCLANAFARLYERRSANKKM